MKIHLSNGGNMKCQVPECEVKSQAKGYCDRHYARYLKYGDPNTTKNLYTKFYDTDTRLRAMVKSWSGCWLTSKENKYVGMSINSQTRYAHRIAYETWVGPIPAGLAIIHMCNNKACINPKHLLLSTQRINMQHKTLRPRTTRKVEE